MKTPATGMNEHTSVTSERKRVPGILSTNRPSVVSTVLTMAMRAWTCVPCPTSLPKVRSFGASSSYGRRRRERRSEATPSVMPGRSKSSRLEKMNEMRPV